VIPWHVSSSSGVATSVSELLYPCYNLLTYVLAPTQCNDAIYSKRYSRSGHIKRRCTVPSYRIIPASETRNTAKIDLSTLSNMLHIVECIKQLHITMIRPNTHPAVQRRPVVRPQTTIVIVSHLSIHSSFQAIKRSIILARLRGPVV